MRSFSGSSTSSFAFPVAGLYVMFTRSFGATDPSLDIAEGSFPYSMRGRLRPVTLRSPAVGRDGAFPPWASEHSQKARAHATAFRHVSGAPDQETSSVIRAKK